MINLKKLDHIASLYTERLILPSEPLRPMWNRENFIFAKPAKWNYIDGALIRGVIMLYEISGDRRLLDYAVKFTDAYVNDDGSVPTLRHEDSNLDNINGGKNLISLYRLTGNEKYRLGFEKIYQNLLGYSRLECGNFFHKAVYPYQIWLDGAYMAMPFMAEYSLVSGDSAPMRDVLSQLKNIVSLMRDEKTGLYFHGYDESRLSCWTDKKSGLSKSFWLRAMGWFCAALADLCELSVGFDELFNLCKDTLDNLLSALGGYITPQNMLMQLPAQPETEGNYPESSGTLLYAYSALKFCRLGLGSEKNKADGIRLLSAVAENYIDLSGDIPVLKNICLMGGLGGPNNRMGDSDYYLSEPIVENDAKGIAPLLMAYAELKKLSISVQ